MRLLQCPRCDTPIIEKECSCGFVFPDHVIRQIEDLRRLPPSDPQLELRLVTREKPRYYRRPPSAIH